MLGLDVVRCAPACARNCSRICPIRWRCSASPTSWLMTARGQTRLRGRRQCGGLEAVAPRVPRSAAGAGGTAPGRCHQRALDAWRRLGQHCPNWWYNELGVPRRISDALLLLHDCLDMHERGQRGQWLADCAGPVKMTEANLVDAQSIVLRHGLLVDDPIWCPRRSPNCRLRCGSADQL
jgi:hypothetical protein